MKHCSSFVYLLKNDVYFTNQTLQSENFIKKASGVFNITFYTKHTNVAFCRTFYILSTNQTCNTCTEQLKNEQIT